MWECVGLCVTVSALSGSGAQAAISSPTWPVPQFSQSLHGLAPSRTFMCTLALGGRCGVHSVTPIWSFCTAHIVGFMCCFCGFSLWSHLGEMHKLCSDIEFSSVKLQSNRTV